MSFVDPNQFIITRKRKKYKFALFHNSPLCFEFDEWIKREVDCLEIGAGTGLFSVELALRHPEKTFLAIDVKGDRLQKGAKIAEEKGLENVFFVRARADQIDQLVKQNSLEQIWVTSLLIKHDDHNFFCWSLEQLVSEKWQIKELNFDLHESALSDEYKIMTTYEKRWIGEGKTINFVRTAR